LGKGLENVLQLWGTIFLKYIPAICGKLFSGIY